MATGKLILQQAHLRWEREMASGIAPHEHVRGDRE